MPGSKRDHVNDDDKDDEDDGRTVKRTRRVPPSPSQQDADVEEQTTTTTSDELGFETETPLSRALMASSERCEAAWNGFLNTRRSDDKKPIDFEGRPDDDVRDFVRRK